MWALRLVGRRRVVRGDYVACALVQQSSRTGGGDFGWSNHRDLVRRNLRDYGGLAGWKFDLLGLYSLAMWEAE